MTIPEQLVIVELGQGPPPPGIAFDPSTVLNVALSNNNLTGTSTSTANPSGCKGFAADAKANGAGKFYFEVVGLSAVGGSQMCAGFNTQGATYTAQVVQGGNGGGMALFEGGAMFVNAGGVAGISISSSTQVIGIAVDLVNMKVWAKNITTGGNWNNNASADPATNSLGNAFTATPIVPFFGWGGGSATGVAMTATFAGPFTGTIPSGFSAWD